MEKQIDHFMPLFYRDMQIHLYVPATISLVCISLVKACLKIGLFNKIAVQLSKVHPSLVFVSYFIFSIDRAKEMTSFIALSNKASFPEL